MKKTVVSFLMVFVMIFAFVPTGAMAAEGDTIDVSFVMLGEPADANCSYGSYTHTLSGNNLEEWIPAAKYQLEQGATVKDLIVKACSENGMEYVEEYTASHIGAKVTKDGESLGDKDISSYSHWMFTVNDKVHKNCYDYQTSITSLNALSDGDSVILHWTDCDQKDLALITDYQKYFENMGAEITSNASITVPGDAKLFVGTKGNHFQNFTQVKPVKTTRNDGTTTYYFDMVEKTTYNYRVSGDDYITYAGKFQKGTDDYTMTVTTEDLKPEGKTKTTVDHDVTSNAGRNVGDVYLNINPQGYLKLDAVDDTFSLVSIRNWIPVDSDTMNYFIEPDYHYTVIDANGKGSYDVVTVDDKGLITAVGEGTAIVLVTYDAINIESSVGGPFFGAIWPENTGVFVVSVGAGESGITTGMTINEDKNNTIEHKLSGNALDSEHDVIYFLGEQGEYSFTPVTAGCAVSVANPVVTDKMTFNGFKPVTADKDGAFAVPLTEGRNIVKIEKDGKAEYQVITAKSVNVTVNEGKPVVAGDALSIKFDTLYNPANKLPGVYNCGAGICYPVGDQRVGGAPGGFGEYMFASKAASQTVTNYVERTFNSMWGTVGYKKGDVFKIPEDFADDTYTLSNGSFVVLGYGDAFGNHRSIDRENGKSANMNAVQREAFLGTLPDIEIPVTELSGITVTTEPDCVSYQLGDSFDPAGMVVSAQYANGQSVEITDYTFSEEVFTKSGKQTVLLSYTHGNVTKTTEVTVKVDPTADEKAVNEVTELIDAIGTVTKDSGKTIAAARDAYDKLSDAQKALVANYDELTAAEKAYADMEAELPFKDLNEDAWYMDSIRYVYTNDIMNGVTSATFEPDSTLTRGMYITMLYRLSGAPEVNGKIAYDDVKTEDWFAKAVVWGTEKGVVEGYAGKFSPDDKITREQMAAMMYRYAEWNGCDVSATASFDKFTDGKSVSDWAKEEMGWAVASKLIQGLDDGSLNPQGDATRAQAATVLQRFAETIVK